MASANTKVMIVDREHDNHREIKSVGRCEVTKVMIVDREHDNYREIKSIGRCEVVQIVQSFVYLGSLIDNSARVSS
ncbi:unnamed protein product [Callosobruchus maculatus]|uniref:Uncharacterized protein n=1 Tax=Callosobruchus maculatus TaxID=64391 RepID=A0A653CL61_CALMS|nr:unnamed protein product [Callosobruchus maculatus]